MKKLLLTSLLVPSISFADISYGIGERNFGPETSQMVACEYAYDKAKQDLLSNYFGENIEYYTRENCRGQKDCKIDVDTFVEQQGVIKKILSKKQFIESNTGYNTCVIVLDAEVESVKNNIVFEVYGNLNYYDGDTIDFSFISNQQGFVSVFNLYQDRYYPIFSGSVHRTGEKYKVESKNGFKLVARLPKGEVQSKDLLVFVFTKNFYDLKKKYSSEEFHSFIRTLDVKEKRILYRYVNIDKKVKGTL